MRKLNAARLNRALTAHHNHSHHNHTGHDCRCDSSSVLTSDVDSTTFVDSDDDDDDDDYQTQEDDYEDLDDEFDRLTQISSTTEDTSVSKAAENREKRRKRMLIQAKLQQQQLHHNHHQQQQHAQAFGNGLNKLSVMGNGGRNKTKNPYAKLNRSLSRASSNSSITDSTMSLNIITVTLHLTSVNFLGISIVGQSYKNGDGGIYVGSIMSGGAVAADGRIDPGDMILQVNEVNFENLSNDKAVEVLREAVSKPGPIKLVIAKCCFPQSNAGAMNSMSGSSTIAGGITSADILAIKKDEPVRPIDPRAWVEHTKIAQGFTDPEYPPRPDSVSTMNSIATTVKEVNYNSIQLTTGMDMLFIARAMAATDSGLEVKDRMWLKITIPGAFLGKQKYIKNKKEKLITEYFIVGAGSEVVDWLYNQVQGFVDRKEAKKYAAAMLKQNYIKHTVNKSSFSEQCYYTFGDLITVVPAMNGLNLNPSPNESTPFAPCVDTVHYGVFGAAPGHGSSG